MSPVKEGCACVPRKKVGVRVSPPRKEGVRGCPPRIKKLKCFSSRKGRQPTEQKKEMSLNVMMNAKVLKGLEEMFQENTVTTIKMLAGKYGFSEEEAVAFMNVGEEVKIVKTKTKTKEKEVKEVKEAKEKKVKEKKEKKEGPKVVLPFCGRVVEEWCEGVKLNHGLYSQCVSERGEEKYCKSCKKQAETNESGKPSLGDISERLLKSSAEYRAEKGKKSVVYAVVMKKLKISKVEAVAEALKFGLAIPEEEFELPKAQRGRPKKVSESESETSGTGEGEKKRRGRPKKNKTVAENESDETDDLIASLVAEANALKAGSAKASAEETEASAEASAEASETEASAEASETDAEEEEESENSVLLQEIVAKINADETYNKLNSMVVPKKERKKHLNAIGEHIKTLLTEEEMALYTGAPEEAEACEAEACEAEEEAEEVEEVEDEATRKVREAAEKKAQLEAEKLKKKEQADLEKKQKKEQADLEKKAKAEADKKAKAEAAAEKKAQLEAEKLKKKEQADLEKKEQAKQKKEQADLEKKAQVKQKEEAAALKKAGPVEKKTTAELQVEPVEEAGASTSQTVNAKVFEFQGKKYLKTEEGILYDQETEECVGVWNEETKSIDDFADDDE